MRRATSQNSSAGSRPNDDVLSFFALIAVRLWRSSFSSLSTVARATPSALSLFGLLCVFVAFSGPVLRSRKNLDNLGPLILTEEFAMDEVAFVNKDAFRVRFLIGNVAAVGTLAFVARHLLFQRSGEDVFRQKVAQE